MKNIKGGTEYPVESEACPICGSDTENQYIDGHRCTNQECELSKMTLERWKAIQTSKS